MGSLSRAHVIATLVLAAHVSAQAIPQCQRPGWFFTPDGTVSAGNATTVTGVSVLDCQHMCENGTWTNCVGFTVSISAASTCQWVSDPTALALNDWADTNSLYIFTPTRVPAGWTTEFDGSVGGTYQTVNAPLLDCIAMCSNGTWANCQGFSRHIAQPDNAVAPCWWVNTTYGFIHDDGNTNEHLWIQSPPRTGYLTDYDGSVRAPYTSGAGTLEECYQQCENGTWSGCAGFSRYSAAADDASAACWWVTSSAGYIYDDGNNNENLYIRSCRPNPTIFISEVMEGTSNNKGIEFYNPLDTSVSLDDYYLGKTHNGGSTVEQSMNFATGATIASGQTYSICNPSIATSLAAQCSTTSSFISHNGDDVYVLMLKNGDVVVDVFGQLGPDPGSSWTVCGDSSATQDNTLVRKPTVTYGEPEWIYQKGTSPGSCQWIINPTNSFTSGHTSVLPSAVPTTPAPTVLVTPAPTVRMPRPPQCFKTGWYLDTDGSVGGTYGTASGTLDDCTNMCQNGTWAGCVGFSRYSAAADSATAACWWVANPTQFILDDGNNNEHLYIFTPTRVPPGWTTEFDGSVGGTYQTVNAPLLDCIAMCSNGTWANCQGFSRHIAQPDSAVAPCWWVNNTLGFIHDDGNTNEHLWIKSPPRVGWTTDYDGSVAAGYTTGTGTLSECYQQCENGTWNGCVGFSRYSAVADATTAACWWVSSTGLYILNDGNNNENLYMHTCTQSPRLFISEVLEGTSNNKGIEFYNPTLGTLSLDDYYLGKTHNGGSTVEQSMNFATGATIASGQTYSICNPSIATSLAAQCSTTSSFISHNGDDVYVLMLKNGDVVVDVFGQLGPDPGSSWTVCGSSSATQDNTLVRKPTVTYGEPEWSQQIGTTPGSCQWIINPTNSFSVGHTSIQPGPTQPPTFAPTPSPTVADVLDTCPAQGWYKDLDGSVGGTYGTGSGTLADCTNMCQNGTWAGCVGFSRYSAPADTATAACWWVTSPTQFILDDGNNNEHLYIFTPSRVPAGWTTEFDGSVGGTYQTVNAPLLDCIAMCSNGTWANCQGFSRHIAQPDSAVAPCWWVNTAFGFIHDDGNTNEHLWIKSPPRVGWTTDYDGSVAAPYNTAAGLTLQTCYQMCENGTWADCKGFSRYLAAADSAPATCWWVSASAQLIYDDGNNNEHMYKRSCEVAPDLFISELMEGTSNNKAIEVYNPTDGTLSLSDYFLSKSHNGGSFTDTYNFPAGATIAAGATYAVCNPSIDAMYAARCDANTSFFNLNGDDVISLVRTAGNVTVDVFGEINVDPGSSWTVCGDSSATRDHTLVRKPSVTYGQIEWTHQIGSNADDCQWNIMPVNVFGFGGHDCVLPLVRAPTSMAPTVAAPTSTTTLPPAAATTTAAPTHSDGAQTSPSSGDDDNTGLIVGIVVAVIVVLLIAAVVIVKTGGKKNSPPDNEFGNAAGRATENPTYAMPGEGDAAAYMDVASNDQPGNGEYLDVDEP